jgi:hypothetical protein
MRNEAAMSHHFRRFDVRGLYAALDSERQSRGLSWAQMQSDFVVESENMRRLA